MSMACSPTLAYSPLHSHEAIIRLDVTEWYCLVVRAPWFRERPVSKTEVQGGIIGNNAIAEYGLSVFVSPPLPQDRELFLGTI